jgi:hypothetical protein
MNFTNLCEIWTDCGVLPSAGSGHSGLTSTCAGSAVKQITNKEIENA